MNREAFNKFRQDLRAEADRITSRKGEKEYASSDDVLENFKEMARRTGLTPFQIWLVYGIKGVTAIEKAIARDPANPQAGSEESLRARCLDAINYFTLLAALLSEQPTKHNYPKGRKSRIPPPLKSEPESDEPVTVCARCEREFDGNCLPYEETEFCEACAKEIAEE
jgi:hypothetical protein